MNDSLSFRENAHVFGSKFVSYVTKLNTGKLIQFIPTIVEEYGYNWAYDFFLILDEE
jgi:hypothetical protein